MEIKIKLNGKMVSDDIPADMLLIDFVRAHNCFSVKRGCETSSCGLCTVLLDDQPVLPGFVMNTIALLRENPDPTDEEILAYLSGNLCRCSGYVGQQRGIRNFLNSRKSQEAERE